MAEPLEHLAERVERALVLVGEQDARGCVSCVVPTAGVSSCVPVRERQYTVRCRGPAPRRGTPAPQPPGARIASQWDDGVGHHRGTIRACRGRASISTDRRAQAAVGHAEDRAARAREDRRLLLQPTTEDGDPAAREALVERFLPLARQLARRYQRGGEPLDDLVQVASLGLLKAIDRFDPQRETAFSSFAVPTILGELKRHFRDKGWSVRVPRDLQELAVKVDRVGEQMRRELGRAPTPAEIAESIGVDRPSRCSRRARRPAPTARSRSTARATRTTRTATASPTSSASRTPASRVAEDAATVERLMRVLTDREREVLRLRFEEDLTQSEIGARVGVSQMHVSRLIRQSVARLREVAEAGGPARRAADHGTGARRAGVARLRGRHWTAAVGSALEPVPLGVREREERGDRMAEIQFKGITKRYPDGFEAVKEIDLDIADGEFMILVGPSGCGKSTALRMIAGLEDITEGDLVIGGERVNDLAAARSRHRDGVPELRAVPAHDGARQHGLRAQARQGRPGRDRPEGRARRRRSSTSSSTSSASRRTSPAASASAWRWAARSCATRSAS